MISSDNNNGYYSILHRILDAGHDDEDGDGVPLNDTTRAIVIVVHYLAFILGAYIIWAYMRKLRIIETRIWSPFLLLTGLIWLQVGSALEIGNHFYVNDWELSGFPSDLVNGTFYFFNFGAQYINALALRKKGVPFFRCPSFKDGIVKGLIDLVAMLFDILMVIAVPITPILYALLGRDVAISVVSAFGAFAGIGSLLRLWRNLGPNIYTLVGGIGFLALALTGVAMTAVYNATGIEWIHIFIGGSFIASLIPFSLAIFYAEPADEIENIEEEDEDIGLVAVQV